MSRYILRKVRLAHCKKGPALCPKCREMDVERFSLLDIDPPRPGQIQRRVIEISDEGRTAWCEYDIVRVFESQEAALDYARQHSIHDVEL
jgi:hypothetical protein